MRVESVSVASGRAVARIVHVTGEPRCTSESPGALERILGALPGLAGHRCDNSTGVSFVAEAADTELAHVIEHVALELMVLSGSPRDISGETRWTRKVQDPDIFDVSLAFDDDLVCLGALRAAVEIVERATKGCDMLDVETVVENLRGLRRTGR